MTLVLTLTRNSLWQALVLKQSWPVIDTLTELNNNETAVVINNAVSVEQLSQVMDAAAHVLVIYPAAEYAIAELLIVGKTVAAAAELWQKQISDLLILQRKHRRKLKLLNLNQLTCLSDDNLAELQQYLPLTETLLSQAESIELLAASQVLSQSEELTELNLLLQASSLAIAELPVLDVQTALNAVANAKTELSEQVAQLKQELAQQQQKTETTEQQAQSKHAELTQIIASTKQQTTQQHLEFDKRLAAAGAEQEVMLSQLSQVQKELENLHQQLQAEKKNNLALIQDKELLQRENQELVVAKEAADSCSKANHTKLISLKKQLEAQLGVIKKHADQQSQLIALEKERSVLADKLAQAESHINSFEQQFTTITEQNKIELKLLQQQLSVLADQSKRELSSLSSSMKKHFDETLHKEQQERIKITEQLRYKANVLDNQQFENDLLKTQLLQLQQSIENYFSQIENVKNELNAEQFKLAELESSASLHGQVVANLRDELATTIKQQAIEKQQAENQKAEIVKQLAEAKQQLVGTEQQLKTVKTQLNQSNVNADLLHQQIQQVEQEKQKQHILSIQQQKKQQREFTKLEQKFKKQRLEMAALKHKYSQLAIEFDAIHTSASWKVAAPVRALSRVIKKVDKHKQRLQQDVGLLFTSEFFDAEWYLETYPDVKEVGANPAEHYLKFGATEGRRPSAEFDGNWYLQRYPDVAVSGINPLLHYIKFGRNEGRTASPKLLEDHSEDKQG